MIINAQGIFLRNPTHSLEMLRKTPHIQEVLQKLRFLWPRWEPKLKFETMRRSVAWSDHSICHVTNSRRRWERRFFHLLRRISFTDFECVPTKPLNTHKKVASGKPLEQNTRIIIHVTIFGLHAVFVPV